MTAFFFPETSANLKTPSLSQQTGTSRGRVKPMAGSGRDKGGLGNALIIQEDTRGHRK